MLPEADFLHAVTRYGEKVGRGGKHLDALNESAQRFVKDQGDPGILCVTEPNSQMTKYLLRVVRVPDFPVEWGVIVGDVVHCFRSALDQLVTTLWSDKPTNTTGFPICLTPRDWVIEAPRMIWSVPKPFVAMLDRAQPYHRGDKTQARQHPIAVLHSLWNLDKHRAIPTTGVVSQRLKIDVTEQEGVTIGEFRPKAGVPVKPDAIIAEAKIGSVIGPKVHVDVKAHMSISVGFGDSGELPAAIRSKPVVDTFHEVIAPAIASVLRDFHAAQHGQPLAEPWLAPPPSAME
jgi:hypothetical protein